MKGYTKGREDIGNARKMKPIVIVPARMASTRLPGKPLADIHGKPMIVQVLDRAAEAGVGPVICACAESEIAEAVREAGYQAVLTDPDHPSGSDRIWEALTITDPDGEFDTIINLQGDLPTLAPALISDVVAPLSGTDADLATLVAEITDAEERTNANVVKCVTPLEAPNKSAPALYFTRTTAPSGDGPLWHHIGIYAYRRAALERFVALPPGVLEKREKLEQLRALEAGMRIEAVRVDTVPLGVDTPPDLERARQMLDPNR